MKAIFPALLLGIMATAAPAEPADLQALEVRYARSQADLTTTAESRRAAFILDLARLRFRLVSEDDPEWQTVDREIIRHPMTAPADPAALFHTRLGVWHSSRHDYLFNADGTWRMIDNPQTTTHGTWLIQGALYSETFVGDDGASATTFTLILADADNFIFTDGNHLFFETRRLDSGLPIRRDEP